MKKIISLVIALIMLQTTALASAAEGFAELWKDYYELQSFKGTVTMSATVNEPLLMLEDIPLEDDEIDYPLMMNDLLSSTATADYSVSISDDYKKMQMAMSIAYDVPISLNKDFKLEAWARMGMWIDYDFTDPEAPVYKMIMKMPFESKYQVFDMTAEYDGDITEIVNPDIISGMSDSMLEIIKKNGDITRTKDGYRVKFDNDGTIGYLIDVFTIAKMIFPEEADIYDEIITAIEGVKGKLVVLGEDGLILDFTKNAQGDITAYIESIHFDFNLYDIATLFELDTEGLVRERANIDITFKAITEISGHNATVVEMPELTEENSEDMYGEYYYEGSHFDNVGLPLFENNAIYYSMDEIMSCTGLEFAPQSADGVLSLTNENGDVITISGNVIKMDDDEWNMEKPQIIEQNGAIYLTEEVLGLLYIDPYTSYNLEMGILEYSIWHDDYIRYPYVDVETSAANNEDYIPPYLYEHVSSDQVPYVEDGEVFIPVYDLLHGMYPGEFNITADSLRYTATKDNNYGIGEVFVKVGENSIMVDNEYITFEKPVVNVDNIFRAPIEFVENFGFTVNNIRVGNFGTSYDLSMPNPEYVAE